MDVVALTRTLVDIPSVSGNESAVGTIVASQLEALGATCELTEVEGQRANVLATFGDYPAVTLSTHLDTVPPFIPSREDDSYVYGRGSCDAKGILACMMVAAKHLVAEGLSNFGVLAVVGEEQGSAGALTAGRQNRGCRYLINGEPTENKLATGSKGALRLRISAIGQAAHSAYPELGESAIRKLVQALYQVEHLELPVDPELGATTVNVGLIRGGSAPNILADSASAELLVRLVGEPGEVNRLIEGACEGLAHVEQTLLIPAQRLTALDGFETTVVRYTSDLPLLCPAWGEGLLIGPGSIHVAHTDGERVLKSQLYDAVELYKQLVVRLLGRL